MAAYAPLGGLPQAQAELQNANTNTQNASTNAMAEYTRAAQEKAQTALLGQQTQAAAQQNQATQAVNQAYQGAFKKDPTTGQMTLDTDGLQQELAQNGHGAAIPAVIKGITDYQASKADLQKKQADLQTSGADAMGNLGYAMQQANYDPRLADTIIQDHLNDPSLTPQMRQSLLQERQQIQQNPALVKQIADQWVLQSPKQQQNAIDRTKAEAEKTKAGASQQTADQGNIVPLPELGVSFNKSTGETQPIAGAAMSPQMMESKYITLAQKKAAGQPLAPDDAAFMKGYEKYKTLQTTANLTMQAGLLNPQAKEMAANLYTQTGQLPAGMRSPAMSAGILNQAAGAPGTQAPNIAQNKMNYGAATALQKSATSGDMAKNITSFNTAIAHASQLKEAADALDNGDAHLLNALGNQMGYQFGSDKTTNFNVIKNALSGEISKVFKGGEATDAEIKAVQEPFSAANSPAQLKGAIDNAIHLMNSKRDALKDQYTQGMKGQPNFGGAQNGQTQGAGGGGGTPPAGATHTAKGSDGKLHYTNAQGQDLGIAQ